MSNQITNIFITGSKKCGKSTLLTSVLKELNTSYEGFITLPFEEYHNGNTYKLVDIKTGVSAPISHFNGENFLPVKHTFDTHGLTVVSNSVLSRAKLLVFDEIGRFERNSKEFLNEITKAFNSNKTAIAVLKKEELPHITEYKQRKDSVLFDLDEVENIDTVKQIILNLLRQKELT